MINLRYNNSMDTLSAIPIREPWIDMILDGLKTWEIRSKFTKKIGPVALIRSKSGTVVGTANLSKPALFIKAEKKGGFCSSFTT